jgi:hypothetical protein
MSTHEEEFDYENDESWYDDAMNAMNSPANNHNIIYTEEDIQELSEIDKTIIRYRNELLKNGFEYIDLQIGDYINEIVFFSSTIQYASCNFALTYKKNNHYMVIFQLHSTDEKIINPIQIATIVYVGHHLGAYQFIEFFHLDDEITDDQKDFNHLTINRELTYKEKPSLEIYKSDNIEKNKKIGVFKIKQQPKVKDDTADEQQFFLSSILLPENSIGQDIIYNSR